jgi:hypothetical protein
MIMLVKVQITLDDFINLVLLTMLLLQQLSIACPARKIHHRDTAGKYERRTQNDE